MKNLLRMWGVDSGGASRTVRQNRIHFNRVNVKARKGGIYKNLEGGRDQAPNVVLNWIRHGEQGAIGQREWERPGRVTIWNPLLGEKAKKDGGASCHN